MNIHLFYVSLFRLQHFKIYSFLAATVDLNVAVVTAKKYVCFVCVWSVLRKICMYCRYFVFISLMCLTKWIIIDLDIDSFFLGLVFLLLSLFYFSFLIEKNEKKMKEKVSQETAVTTTVKSNRMF